jgi:predicted DNA-binding ribbon-helix-helix protein
MLLKNFRLASGVRSSMALEREFWDALEYIAAAQSTTVKDLIQRIDGGIKRTGSQGRAGAVRVFVIKHMLGNALSSPTCPPTNSEG